MKPSQVNLSKIVAKKTVALVLAGGRGSRLYELTDDRAKPATYFGGKYRIVDFVLSNCLNSGIRKIGVITQYKSHSLLRHLQRGWSFLRGELGEFIDLLPAQQRIDEEHWYRGTADAIYQNKDILDSYHPDYVVILAGDHVYKMDYSLMLLDHIEHGYPCTIACIEVPRNEATAFGVMAIDQDRKIIDFIEKPLNPPAIPDNADISLASMGIYIFNAQYLKELLANDVNNIDSSHDFGKDVIPIVVKEGKALAHPFNKSCVPQAHDAQQGLHVNLEYYWRDVGTLDAFWSANLDLTKNFPTLNIYDENWPVWTYQEQLPPAKFVPDLKNEHGTLHNTLLAGGCIVCGSYLSDSILSSNVLVSSFCSISESVILPQVRIGENCRLSKVVVDRGCIIPDNMVIGEDAELDAQNFHRTESGVILVTQPMLNALLAS